MAWRQLVIIHHLHSFALHALTANSFDEIISIICLCRQIVLIRVRRNFVLFIFVCTIVRLNCSNRHVCAPYLSFIIYDFRFLLLPKTLNVNIVDCWMNNAQTICMRVANECSVNHIHTSMQCCICIVYFMQVLDCRCCCRRRIRRWLSRLCRVFEFIVVNICNVRDWADARVNAHARKREILFSIFFYSWN